MPFFSRLSGRSRQALRVFGLSVVVTLIFCATPVYQLAELSFYDYRLEKWLETPDSGHSAGTGELSVYLYQFRDSTRAAGLDGAALTQILTLLEQAGVSRIYLLSEDIFENIGAHRAEFPDIVETLQSDEATGSLEDRERLFLETSRLPVDSLLDYDGNLRALPWDHPAVEFTRDIADGLGLGRPQPRGPRIPLKLDAVEIGKAGTSEARGSSLEYLYRDLTTASANSSVDLDYLKDKVVFIEKATVEASTFAKVSTSRGTITAGQIYLRLFESIAEGWTLEPLGPVAVIFLFCLIVGSECLTLSGRKPAFVACVGFASVFVVFLASYRLLPNGYDAPVLAILVGQTSSVMLMVSLEMRRGRQFLRNFGGAEDAQFKGEESMATMVFSNLPPYLLEMERHHDEDLLKYRRDYNEVLAVVARRYHGKVLDFQGDAQMLGFGLRYDDDTEHAAEATSAAMEIVDAVAELADRWSAPVEQLTVHAGVCTGSIALGHLGAQQKQDIAAIGDTTNTAARLMGAAMKQKVPVLISKPTFEMADGVISGEERPPVELKGKSLPVEVFLATSVDPEWQKANRAKGKDLVPTGGTLVYKGQRQSGLVMTIVMGFLGFLVVNGLWRDRVFDRAEAAVLDTLHRAVGLVDADPRIMIFGIDETSIADSRLGRFPWSRAVYAQAIRNLSDSNHKGLFLDIMFKKARANDPEGDESFAQALAEDWRTVIGSVFYRNRRYRLQEPQLFPAADFSLLRDRYQLGLIHEAIDEDNIARSGYLTAQETESHSQEEAHLRRIYPAAAAALLLAPGDRLENGAQEVRLGERVVFTTPVDEQGKSTIPIRFGPTTTGNGLPPQPGSYKLVSFSRLLDPNDSIFEELDGKYLLVGQTLTTGEANEIDRIETVVGRLKGVEVHARILDNLLNENYFRQLSLETRGAMLWLVSLMTLFILTRYREPKAYLARLLALAILVGLSYVAAFWAFGLISEIVILWLSILLVAGAVLVGRYVLTFRALTMVIPAEIAEELLFHHSTKDRRQVATILLTDIRGYTTLSEGRTAVAMLDVLNEYHKRTVACYDRYGGQALTYQGDAQIVVFGVFGNRQNPAADAVSAALGLQSICDDLREEWGIESRDDFDVGAGLCTGEVEVGLLGGSTNLQYSVVGETVRKAHKVQSLSAELEAPVILDEETYEATAGAVAVDDLGLVQPKGLPHEIRLYRAKSVSE
jgi:adenylate cyclase